ncbi:unnamed protein product [Lupinus luteus]|uniref:RRM domain-containing protein n=1 Tax=Lupinus luteus TaxID=3873 RepID=A0AAV1WPL9_LUPLU
MAANATLSLCFNYSFSNNKPQFPTSSKRCVSFSPVPIVLTPNTRVCTALKAEQVNDDVSEDEEQWMQPRATEVYVFNLPRSIDSEYLLHLFSPHGNVLYLQVSRNAETGESKGCAYVTLDSINSAKNAVSALDGLDVGGREMRVRFSVEMNRRGKNRKTMNSSPKKVIYYEAPYQLYVGNLPKRVRPEELRHLFVRFGTVASLRIFIDTKEEISRVYAFVSFLSERERDAAMSINGIAFGGRTLVLRQGGGKV